jgi:hypothetical protein
MLTIIGCWSKVRLRARPEPLPVILPVARLAAFRISERAARDVEPRLVLVGCSDVDRRVEGDDRHLDVAVLLRRRLECGQQSFKFYQSAGGKPEIIGCTERSEMPA